jgi:hypothetical protein
MKAKNTKTYIPTQPMAELSEYELFRLSNIERNEQIMTNLFQDDTHLKKSTVEKKSNSETKEKAKSTDKLQTKKHITRRNNSS